MQVSKKIFVIEINISKKNLIVIRKYYKDIILFGLALPKNNMGKIYLSTMISNHQNITLIFS